MYNHEPENYKCPFCTFVSGEESEFNKQESIVFQDDEVLAYISPKWWPNNPGNVIIIPQAHVENVYDISQELLCKIYGLGKDVALAMKKAYKCDAVSFRQHNEPAGNQAIWHFHMHVLPRWENDDLYINHNKSRYVSIEEIRPYARQLRKILN